MHALTPIVMAIVAASLVVMTTAQGGNPMEAFAKNPKVQEAQKLFCAAKDEKKIKAALACIPDQGVRNDPAVKKCMAKVGLKEPTVMEAHANVCKADQTTEKANAKKMEKCLADLQKAGDKDALALKAKYGNMGASMSAEDKAKFTKDMTDTIIECSKSALAG